MKKALRLFAILLACALPAPIARAAEGFYVGAGAGRSSFGTSTSSANYSLDDTTLRAVAGVRNPYGAFEIGYTDLGSIDATGGTETLHVEGDIWSAWFIGILPFNKYFDFSVKAGYGQWETQSEATDGFTTVDADNDGGKFIYGLGLGFNLVKHFGIRVDWDVYGDLGDADDVKNLGAMLQFYF